MTKDRNELNKNRRNLLQFAALLGLSTISASLVTAIQAGVSADSAGISSGLSDNQQRVVSLLSEMIIPTTDTPGAITAGVPGFITTIVVEWYHDEERKIFFDGLDALERYCLCAENKSFYLAAEATR